LGCSSCYDYKDLVSIVVQDSGSEEKKTYRVPRELLRWHSSYFAAAFDPDSDFHTSDEGEVNMEDSLPVFDAFHCWLLTGRLKDPPSSEAEVTCDEYFLSRGLLMEIWVFADMRGIPALGNAAIDMLHERFVAGWRAAGKELKDVYDMTTANSGLRRYIVDMYTMTHSLDSFMKKMDADVAPVEFLLEVLPRFVSKGPKGKGIGRTAWTRYDRCTWHDHSGPGGQLRLESRK
jgi:hypothetical protein